MSRHPPSKEFVAQANLKDAAIDEAAQNLDRFWMEQARRLDWIRTPEQGLHWTPPHATWFADGTLNASANCLDRHMADRPDQVAIAWEGEDASRRDVTYRELLDEVQRAAAGLRALGVGPGDTVSIYLPMIPELPVIMLACARIGAIHNVVFAGFSPNAFAQRVAAAGSRVVISADGYLRKGRLIPHKQRTDDALQACSVDHAVIVQRTGNAVPMQAGRDVTWTDFLRDEPVEPVAMEAEAPLFMMYTSGTTGQPKGIVHSTGGYLTGVLATTRWVLDLKPGDVYWCMADIGWITGHSYIVYGPLMVGATVVLYEGAPDWPSGDRPWQMIARHGVQVFYTSPTAIRSFIRCNASPSRHDLSSLRLLGSVGEPINPAAWRWYHEHVGGGRCPIVDTWWQTETGAMMATPLPGITATKPGAAMRPVPGVSMEILDDHGHPVPDGSTGLLAITRPWPSMLRTLWNDPERYVDAYWSKWAPDIYFTGDSARRDADGDLWILGRMDDVMNVAGHRLGTAELESALVADPDVAEAAVIAATDALKGQVPVAFVQLRDGADPEGAEKRLVGCIDRDVGPIARPKALVIVPDLPRTRSGKIMRRILKAVWAGEDPGNTMTLSNPEAVERLQAVVG